MKRKILFVCMGNICRSPAAEGIMKKLVKQNNLDDIIEVDSAGTISYHTGEKPDPRMTSFAKKRGYELDSIARHFTPSSDFMKFDYIVTMDDDNYNYVKSFDPFGKYSNKIFRMTSFSKEFDVDEVPDPYYGSSSGFENVLDIIENSTKGLLEKVLDDIKQQNN